MVPKIRAKKFAARNRLWAQMMRQPWSTVLGDYLKNPVKASFIVWLYLQAPATKRPIIGRT